MKRATRNKLKHGRVSQSVAWQLRFFSDGQAGRLGIDQRRGQTDRQTEADSDGDRDRERGREREAARKPAIWKKERDCSRAEVGGKVWVNSDMYRY